MEGTTSQQILCKAGCGFFGNPNTNELCSVCYKKSNSAMQEPLPLKPSPSKEIFKPVLNVTPEETKLKATIVIDKSENASSEVVAVDEKKKKNRCNVCKKKLGLIPFDCRCGGMYCGLHRYSDRHDCKFNYQELGREEFQKVNPLVVAKKINKF